MGWTKPFTWVGGYLAGESDLNAQLRDNMNALGRVGKLDYLMEPSAGDHIENLIDAAWLELNGAAVSRTGYPDYYAKLNAAPYLHAYTDTSTLKVAVDNSPTTTNIQLNGAWPADWPVDGRPFLIEIDQEKMLVPGQTATPGTNATLVVTRAVEGTAIQAHAVNAAISTPSQPVFGSGDGSTTFNIPDLQGRTPWAMGTHADVATLGFGDGVSVGNRRPKHNHSVMDGANPASMHVQWGSGGAQLTQASGAANVGFGGVGPQSAAPTDAPAHLVLGIWVVKALV